MQSLEVSGEVRPIYGSGTTHIWVVRRQTVNLHLNLLRILIVLKND